MKPPVLGTRGSFSAARTGARPRALWIATGGDGWSNLLAEKRMA
jgi:hypothetical protein